MPNTTPLPTALVTGASSGIGATFARHLAGSGYRLVLVARNADRLTALRAELITAGAPDVEVLPADLTEPGQRELVGARLRATDHPVTLLVNNAGIGLGKDFDEVTEAELLRQLELNVTAVLLLTRAVLPGMVERGSGGIINVASIAALFPNPGASYSGTKAWVVAFTEGLAITLRGTDVRVQALCPGLVRTEFHPRAGINLGNTPSFTFIDVDKLVAASLADLRRGTVVSIPGRLYKTVALLTKLLPRRLNRALAARVYAIRGR